MRVLQILVSSTHHVNQDEQEKCLHFESLGPQTDAGGALTGWTLENMGAFFERGWVMRVHPEAAQHDLSQFSKGLQDVIWEAVAAGARYIHFDSQEELDPEIVEYRH